MRNPNIPSWLEGRWNSEQDAGWEARSKTLELGGKRAELLAAMRSTDRSPQTKIHNNTTPHRSTRWEDLCSMSIQSYQSFKGFSSFAAPPASSIALRISHSNSCKARVSEPTNKPPIRPSTVPAIRPKLLRSIKMKET